jgi:hypothetical protein
MSDTNAVSAAGQARLAAIRELWQTDDADGPLTPSLFCLLDAAQDDAIYPRLRKFAANAEIASLYQGESAGQLAAVAPYLVHLGSDTAIFDWFWEHGWRRHWGIFAWAATDFETLRGHFRRLTRVRTEDGRVLLFRFYDPRILSVFLPTCDAGQLATMFGPAERYGVPLPSGRLLATYRRTGDGLAQARIDLERPPP